MIKKFILYIFLLASVPSFAGEYPDPPMADAMREDGKIYVVITVMAVVFVCVAAYLVIIDRKVKKLEERLKK
jgi:CcmD family protein